MKSLIKQAKEDIELETLENDERYSFDVEYKVRDHVKQILKAILRDEDELYKRFAIQSERSIAVEYKSRSKNLVNYNNKKYVRPDLEILLKDGQTSRVIVEVKRLCLTKGQ